jgi:hypothetical protein
MESLKVLDPNGRADSAVAPKWQRGRGQAPAGTTAPGVTRSGLAASEDILLDDRVNAPISINHLGDAEVDANCN